jgi:tetratricopeptide (TPR) repeat protein
VCLHAQRDFAGAEKRIRAALRLVPTSSVMHLNHGNALRELGRLPEAVQSYERAARLDAKFALAHFNLATAWEQLRRPDLALASYERAFALGAGAPALAGRGNCFMDLGRAEEAVAAYHAALASNPEMIDVRANLGVALDQLGRQDEALVQTRMVLDRQPGHLRANRLLLSLKPGDSRTAEWLPSVLQLRAQAPEDVELMILHAAALTLGRQLKEACQLLEQIVAQRPNDPLLIANLAWHRTLLGDPEGALSLCEEAFAKSPDHLEVWQVQGLARFHMGEFADARANFVRCLEIEPKFTRARFQCALLDLLEGQLEAGFASFELRFIDKGGDVPVRSFAGAQRGSVPPIWRGEEARGKRVVVYSEQGLGDLVQCIRYVPLMQARVGQVIVEVPPPAMELMRRILPSSVHVLPFGAPLPDGDYVCPLLSLPLAMGTTLASIPAPIRFGADPARARLWRNRLGPARGRRVGLTWSGNPFHLNDTQRSIALGVVQKGLERPRGGEGIAYLALQNHIREGDRAALADFGNLTYLGEAIRDLEDMVALISLCDAVVSVDTASAHVAGSMGVPVLLLLPRVPDWRWMLDREDSPWYPSLRLLRQQDRGQWGPVLQRVAAALENMCQGAAP